MESCALFDTSVFARRRLELLCPITISCCVPECLQFISCLGEESKSGEIGICSQLLREYACIGAGIRAFEVNSESDSNSQDLASYSLPVGLGLIWCWDLMLALSKWWISAPLLCIKLSRQWHGHVASKCRKLYEGHKLSKCIGAISILLYYSFWIFSSRNCPLPSFVFLTELYAAGVWSV